MTTPLNRTYRTALLVLLSLPTLACAQEKTTWRYSLKPGDHLIYTETIHRITEGSNVQSEIELKVTNHVIVLGELPGGLVVGMQRNRRRAELLAYRENGRDKLASESDKFKERLNSTPARWSETNWFDPSGRPQLPWAAVRESNSRILLGVHEIESLPPGAVAKNEEWRSMNPLGFSFRYVGDRTIDKASCRVAEASARSIHSRFIFCPDMGAISQVELEGTQMTFAGQVSEQITLHLDDVKHGESIGRWLASPETRLAALRAALVRPSLHLASADLETMLPGTDDDARVLALAILRQRGASVPAAVQATLRQSHDPRIQRILAPPSSDPVCAVTNDRAGLKAQVPGPTLRYMEDSRYLGTPYILRIPEDYSPTGAGKPLLVYLSGGPGLAIDAANGAERTLYQTDYIVLYPNAGGEMWWTKEQTAKVRTLIDEVLPKLNIDRSRVYLSGFSNGGTGTLYYATLWPEQFSAIAPLMGAGNCIDDIRPLALNKLANVPALLLHGDKDEIIPSSCSEDAYRELRKYSPKSEFHMLKGRGHEITLGNDDDLTLSFLNSHPRCTLPAAAERHR